MPKVLVANRGEIAVRILRSATELGWATVAVYTDNDTSHATFADEAVKLSSVADFLSVETIVEVAKRTQCTHLHPGYGFLSESPTLALALSESSVTFIGPSIDTLRTASDKILSRNLAISLGVNVAAGSRVHSNHDVHIFAKTTGYPVMIKALDGGGGRGIRVVNTEADVDEAFKRCLGESPSRQLFAEKALTGPNWKHIEVQIVGDGTGEVNHLWERECSVQRRFQKIVEVAPSRLPRGVVSSLLNASLKLARSMKYRGLGTFEYLVNAQTNAWVFLEINPRIQVEHTVTEEVMNIDLVRTQLLLSTQSTVLASLSLHVPPHPPRGHAIQLRLTAEDPYHAFRLSPGRIRSSDVIWPTGRGVRVDTWLSPGPALPDAATGDLGWTVGTDFDSLLAKVIISGNTFAEATQKAKRALRELRLAGEVKTNIQLLAGVVEHVQWVMGSIDTMWLERSVEEVLDLGGELMSSRRLARGLDGLGTADKKPTMSTSAGNIVLQPGALFYLTLSPAGVIQGAATTKHTLTLSSIAHNGFPDQLSGTIQTTLSPTPLAFSLSQSSSAAVSSSSFELADPNNPKHVASPLTGKVVELHPALEAARDGLGDERARRVAKGEPLIVLSMMKMESVVVAPSDGVVGRIGKGIQVGVILGEGMLVCIVGARGELVSRL